MLCELLSITFTVTESTAGSLHYIYIVSDSLKMADIDMLIGKTLSECEEIIKSNRILSNGWCLNFI